MIMGDAMLKITAVCSAGILLEYQGSSILIDGIAESYAGFFGLPDALFQDVLDGSGSFSGL